MSEGDSNGSRKGAGSALLIVVALYPEVTCSLLEIKLMCHYCIIRIIRINCSCHSLFSGIALASARLIQIEVLY